MCVHHLMLLITDKGKQKKNNIHSKFCVNNVENNSSLINNFMMIKLCAGEMQNNQHEHKKALKKRKYNFMLIYRLNSFIYLIHIFYDDEKII